ncbi:MAG TPA: UDP-N-acetylglucosamine 2-epimerase (non-hydrolyzing) [Gemmatimonadaceae bacterium]|nr:UDP-N-acetylglucosamine 2-epimerase (non-hydrolyzing) [Gemmatimonadaceae bacterium]
MRVLVVAGARPNFVKIAPIMRELERSGAESVLVHTGQHYDASMSDSFFAELRIRRPDHSLGVGSGSHAQQTARIMSAFEPVLLAEQVDWVLVAGDVNSTLACSLVAAKLREERGLRIAHVEAGLRSRDWRMPEEVNRVLTDRLSDLLLTPSRDAEENLASEGIRGSHVVFVGNVMIDTLMEQLPSATRLGVAERLGLPGGGYAVATLHRPSNVDHPESLREILHGLSLIAGCMPVVLPLHPRTRSRIEAFGLGEEAARLRIIDPLTYPEMLSLANDAAVALTDSGGVQEETSVMGVPCVTLREQTERPVTITEGTNRLAPWPLTSRGIQESFERAIETGRVPLGARAPEGWDGRAAARIVAALERGR